MIVSAYTSHRGGNPHLVVVISITGHEDRHLTGAAAQSFITAYRRRMNGH